jgi:hypothetical protein
MKLPVADFMDYAGEIAGRLDGPPHNAELLVGCAHTCADWNVWGGPMRVRYWDALTDRVRVAAHSGRTTAKWWETVSRKMSLGQPEKKEDRALLAQLLEPGDDENVLLWLRENPGTIVLRVRVASDAVKDAKEEDRRQKPLPEEGA